MTVEINESFIGYIRVSTEEQNYDMQRDSMLAAGVHPELICEDIESGWAPKKERPGLRNALKLVRSGSSLLVWKLDRLGRNTAELILTVHRLHERGVNFRSLTQSEINTSGMQTATGRLVFHLFCALAQFESDQLSERTKAGMRAARARGVKFGRVGVAEKWIDTGAVARFQVLRADGVPIKTALKEIGIPLSTYKKYQLVMEPPSPVDDIGDGVGLPV